MSETDLKLALNEIEAMNNVLAGAEIDLHVAVAEARRAGVAWSSIGDRLGVSKQAAQQRFGVQPLCEDQLCPGNCGGWHP
jgi:hypothetical protein